MSVPPAAQPSPFCKNGNWYDIPADQFPKSREGFLIPLTQRQVAQYQATIALKRRVVKAHMQIQEKEASPQQSLGKPHVYFKIEKPIEEMAAKDIEEMHRILDFQIWQENFLKSDETIS
jgi:hypothetical protein